MSEEDSASSPSPLTEEKKYDITTDKNNKMDLFLRNYNNEIFEISIYTKNKYPSKKYEYKGNLEKVQKNNFFKIFNSISDILKELDNKIKKSIFIEEDKFIESQIYIGLTVIENIKLEINETEKTTEEIHQELIKKIEEQNNEIENLKKQLKECNNRNNNLTIQVDEKNENINKNNQEILKLNENYEKLKNDKINKETELNNTIRELKNRINNLNEEKRKREEEEKIKRQEEEEKISKTIIKGEK